MKQCFSFNVKNLNKKIKKKNILQNISFNCKSGQIIGIVGPNGAGKSSLFKILSSLWNMDDGEILINNSNILELLNKDFFISSCIENVSLYHNLSGMDNIKIISNLYQINDINYINYLIDKFKLRENIDKKVYSYSLGMKQKLGLILTLIPNHDLLILDEPTNSLDIESVQVLHDIIKNLKSKNKLILISSHILEELESICDKVYILYNGKISYEYDRSNDNFTYITFDKKVTNVMFKDLFDISLIDIISENQIRIPNCLLNNILLNIENLNLNIEKISKNIDLKYEFNKITGGNND